MQIPAANVETRILNCIFAAINKSFAFNNHRNGKDEEDFQLNLIANRQEGKQSPPKFGEGSPSKESCFEYVRYSWRITSLLRIPTESCFFVNLIHQSRIDSLETLVIWKYIPNKVKNAVDYIHVSLANHEIFIFNIRTTS